MKKSHPVQELSTVLNLDNINQVIRSYNGLIARVPIREIQNELSKKDAVGLFHELKRGEIADGPYCQISIFEASNRIMTDLTILFGVKELLFNPKFKEFEEFKIEYGNGNTQLHDIESTSKLTGRTLIGEAFNVAPSYFHTKKSKELSKMKARKNSADFLLLLFNKDAITVNTTLVDNESELHLPVDMSKAYQDLIQHSTDQP